MAEQEGGPGAGMRSSRGSVPVVCLDGLPLTRGAAVELLWPDPPGGGPGARWYVGRVAAVTRGAVVVEDGDVLTPVDGAFRSLRVESDRVAIGDVGRRLRWRLDRALPVDRVAATQDFVVDEVSEEVGAYYGANVLQRTTARVRNETKALARSLRCHVLLLGCLSVQLSGVLGSGFKGCPLMVEFFSGPFRSMSHALQVRGPARMLGGGEGGVGGVCGAWFMCFVCGRAHAVPQRCFTMGKRRVATVTVDSNLRFEPDVLADLQTWNFWSWLLGFIGVQADSEYLWMPAHLHFSPPCTSFGWARRFCGRVGQYVGGFRGVPPAHEANCCVFAMCHLLRQVAALDVVVTYTVENPLGNALWDLPCMQALVAVSVVLDVSYCLYGCDLPKCTRIVCHPSMRFDWAHLCSDGLGVRHYQHVCLSAGSASSKGACGGFMPASGAMRPSGPVPPPTFKHAGREGCFSVLEAEMPLLLCGQLHTSWMAIDGALRRSSARLRQVRRSAVRRLAANWLLSFGPHVVPLGPPAAPVVAPAAAAQPAAMDVVVAAPAAVAVAAAVADDVPCARCTLVRPCVALCAECCGECCDSYSAWVAR